MAAAVPSSEVPTDVAQRDVAQRDVAQRDVAEESTEAAGRCSPEQQLPTDSCGSSHESGTVYDLEQLGRFLKYDFVDDEAFVTGWRRISRTLPNSMLVEKYLDAKLFYYGTVVERISESVRWRWRGMLLGRIKGCIGSATSSVCHTCPSAPASCISMHPDVTDTSLADVTAKSACGPGDLAPSSVDPVPCDVFPSSMNSCPVASCDGSQLPNVPSSTLDNPAAPYPSSFAEIIRTISAGLELPGLERPSIVATNTPPTAPAMQRPSKPWERYDLSTC